MGEWRPRVMEHCASRNIQVGDRAKVIHEKVWYSGEVVDKYLKPGENTPHIMVKTDEKVDDPQVHLNGFGIECLIDGDGIMFEYEKYPGDEIFTRTQERDMTPEEMSEYF